MKPQADLASILGSTPPASVSTLSEETLVRLAEQVAAAKKQLQTDLEESIKVAIAGVPFAVRGLVKKALLG